ncbi:hypothetical protein ABZ819_33175 [Streptomyces venezuelae]|uniref:hypothetical protein n=1 Tax=Streptomyces venezuelae TaxID=54571 RepID=UPI00343BEFD8
MLRASAALGCVPLGVGTVPVDAVDVVARSLVELCRKPDAAGGTYHLTHPDPVPLTDVFAAMRRAGYPLDGVDAEQWWSFIDDHAADPASSPQAALRDLTRYSMITEPEYRVPRIRALGDSGILPPPPYPPGAHP